VETEAEKRALMASFKMQRRDQLARQLMVTERRTAAQQRVRHSAHSRNMAATREAREAAEQRQEEEERARAAALARAHEHQYPLPSFSLVEDAQQHRCQASEVRCRRRRETGNHGGDAPSIDAPSTSGMGTSSAGNSGAYY
jgi:hypothetical protein